VRILHLAYEDPRQPGSGGGSVRTREINRRLAENHAITAIVAGYPGARERVEWGVRWVPVGTRRWEKLDRLAYFAFLHREVHRVAADVIVEDFGAPFSVGLAPLTTRKPVIASVQWLFADRMRAKYGLPFDRVEQVGLRAYGDFIAVSDWLADELRRRRPGALVEVIPNGIEEAAFAARPLKPRHLVFVGRLDAPQKGCDMLPEIMARIRASLGAQTPILNIIGDGPDRPALEDQIQRRGLEGSIRFLGRLEGSEKYAVLSAAHAVLMPSRFETFGMVAVETQAAATPLVAFDVGPLAEVVGAGGALLIPPFDLDAFARAVIELVVDPHENASLRANGRTWARRYDWDALALQQEGHYLRTLERFRNDRIRPQRKSS